MLWFILALSTAFFVSTGDTLVKRFFSRFSPREMAIVQSVYSLPLAVLAFFFIPIPELGATFWQLVVILVPLDVTAFYLYMKAIKISPLSLCIPFLSFTPVFMVFTGFFILGEMPNRWGVAGILLVAVGSYVLHIGKLKDGYFAPIKAIISETGSILMLVVSVMFSFMAVLGKKAILHSSPIFFGFLFLVSLDLVTLALFPLLGKVRWKKLLTMYTPGTWVGLMLFLHVLCHTLAISMVEAVYMISVKRMSILFSVVYGWLVFKETDIRHRFMGACLMFLGVLGITLLG
ncbi:MAG: DMT family transporter [Deltaproteobacteria bacterium]|nr:DMT family transporter [Deltaproteobacteria bacterium]